MKDNNAYLEILLNDYKRKFAKYANELAGLPEGELKFRNDRGNLNYVHYIKREKQKPLRKGITSNHELISQLARKKFLALSTKVLKEEISRLEIFIKNRTEPTVQNILDMLPYNFQQLDERLFFPQKKQAEEWANDPYPQNTKNVHEKIHITSTGVRVRSKSELIIAEKLDSYGISYRYDSLIYYKSHTFSPDFTIKTEEEPVYWEHCGMMENANYRNYNNWKIEQYEKMGIIPGKNLIITYDTEDGGINLPLIDVIIKTILT